MNKLNILKPDLSNLYLYFYTGLFFITVSIIDVFLKESFEGGRHERRVNKLG